MIGTKLYKNNEEDMKNYPNTAEWCNNNNAHIEDKGEYYEVCENTPPTKAEKIALLEYQYEADKDALIKYYADASLHDDTDLMAELKEEMAEVDEQFTQDMEKLEG